MLNAIWYVCIVQTENGRLNGRPLRIDKEQSDANQTRLHRGPLSGGSFHRCAFFYFRLTRFVRLVLVPEINCFAPYSVHVPPPSACTCTRRRAVRRLHLKHTTRTHGTLLSTKCTRFMALDDLTLDGIKTVGQLGFPVHVFTE